MVYVLLIIIFNKELFYYNRKQKRIDGKDDTELKLQTSKGKTVSKSSYDIIEDKNDASHNEQAKNTQEDNMYNELNSGHTKELPASSKQIEDDYDHALIPPNDDMYHELGKKDTSTINDDVYDHASAQPAGDEVYHKLDIRNPKRCEVVEDTYDHTVEINIDGTYSSLQKDGYRPAKNIVADEDEYNTCA